MEREFCWETLYFRPNGLKIGKCQQNNPLEHSIPNPESSEIVDGFCAVQMMQQYQNFLSHDHNLLLGLLKM